MPPSLLRPVFESLCLTGKLDSMIYFFKAQFIYGKFSCKGSDCQRYLYFVCEYDTSTIPSKPSSVERWEKSLSTTSTTTTTTTTPPLPPRTSHSIRPILWRTSTPATTTQKPPPQATPNYVGVVGFKGIPKHTNANPLNLAVLEDNNS